MPMIQITDVIPEGDLRESVVARRALVGLKVMADDRQVAGIRTLNPSLPCIPDTYAVTFDQLMTALWAANKPEVSADWEVLRPHLVHIPHSCAKVMHTVRIGRRPELPGHPDPYVEALRGREFLLDFDEIAAYFAGDPTQERPSTRFLPVPLSRIVTTLHQSHQQRAAEYWQSQWALGFLPIPVEHCQLSRVE